MCHKCEAQNNLHLEYIKYRGFKVATELANENIYDLLMLRAAENTKAMIAKIENGGSNVTEKDFSLFSLVTEKIAIEFADQYINKIHLEKDAEVAKTIERLVAALTLIQSKAILIGSDAIALDAGDALNEYKTKSFNFGQSAAELKAMLDEHK